MCGITGIFAFNSVGRISLVHLEKATRCLEQRGPDVQDSWFDGVAGLGHRRLSIIDTSPTGNQPMADASGRYRIIYNGEVYNFRSIRKELQQKGVAFRSETDTEVLLYAYIHWGTDFLQRLNGFFALAIYDQEEESLFLARDRFGIKPLVYHTGDDKFLFASEMKSLLAYGIDRKINRSALRLYFQLTYIPAPHSILEGVQKLEPGHYLKVGKSHVEKQKYYEFPYTGTPKLRSFEQAGNDLVDQMRAAVHDRLVADVPLGAFLSGGIDSSIIVALASEQVSDFKTFSIGFKDNAYFDETRYANLVAERYKTDHRVFSLTNDDLLNSVDAAVDYLDEPFADSSALPVYILSKETRKHVTVALSGDGADEVFSGYNKHSAWLMSLQKNAGSAAVASFGWLWRALPRSRSNKLTDTFRKLDRFAKAQGYGLKERYWFLASFTQDNQIDRLLEPTYRAENFDLIKEPYLRGIVTGDLNEVLAADAQLVLPGDMLTKVDLMSMANSLEVRVPFLDHRVVSAAFDMPVSFKAKGNQRKIILREAFRAYLPDELYGRPKHGFEVPLLSWFRKELKDDLDQMVFNREKIEAQGLFEWKEIARAKRKLHAFNPGDVPVLVWSLFVFQNWYDRYFDH